MGNASSARSQENGIAMEVEKILLPVGECPNVDRPISKRIGGLLVVEDQGFGVPDKLRTKLFQPFFTTKSGRTRHAICQTILQTLGGSIQLQDNAEPGATFQIVLPPVA